MRGVVKCPVTAASVVGAGAMVATLSLSHPAAAHDPGHMDIEGVWMAFAVEPSARLGGLTAKLSDAGGPGLPG